MGSSFVDGDDFLVKGDDGTRDGVKITATTDGAKKRLDVSANFSSVTTTVPSWSKKLRYDDMNASTGGIARGTNISGAAFVTIYSYSGSGFLAGVIINVETFNDWTFQLEVDGETIFTFTSSDLTTDSLYDVDDISDFNKAFLGVSKGAHDTFVWHPPLNAPMYYATSVTVKLKKSGGAKKFQAGLAILSKET
jgi:hypothetical protein